MSGLQLNTFISLTLGPLRYALPSGWNEQVIEDEREPYILILFRSLTHEIICKIESFLKTQVNSALIINGPGDSGKSTLLFFIARYYSKYPVIFLNSSDVDPAIFLQHCFERHFDLLTQIFTTEINQLKNEVETALRSDQKEILTTLAIRIFNNLRRIKGLFLLIDQWNAFFRQDNLFTSLFTNVTTLKNSLNRGIVVCAPSSSFDPIMARAAADDDFIIFSHYVVPYNDQELQAYLNFHLQQLGDLVIPQSLTIDIIREWTGSMPRMISYLRRELLLRSPIVKNNQINLDKISIADLRVIYFERAKKYYKQRLYNIFSRHGEAKNYAFSVKFFKNRLFEHPDALWINSGIFKEVLEHGHNLYQVVCPPALDAILEYLKEHVEDAIRVMAQDPSTRWRAFELLFSSTFIPNGGFLEIPLRGLYNQKTHLNRDKLIIQVDRFYFQNEDDTLPISAIEPGTLIICRGNFLVIDFFIHSRLGDKIFFQLSESAYSDHRSKVGDLFAPKLSVEGDLNIYQFFYRKAGGRGITFNSLDEDSFYIYLTNKNRQEVQQNRVNLEINRKIILVTADECQEWGGNWRNVPEIYH